MADQENTFQTICAQCGSAFTQGGKGRPRKFCSVPCTRLAATRAKNKRISVERRSRWPIHCAHCRKEMKPARAKMLCSNACKVASWKAKNRVGYVPPLVRVEARALRLMASRVRVTEARARTIRAKREDIVRRKTHSCIGCGTGLSGLNLKVLLCAGCAELRAKATKRAGTAARKARERAATTETFDPFEVFDRDHWRCHLCGCRTPKGLRGSYADNAPELDHIIPLAAGGEHSRRNTACSCRKCNIMKSDKPLGQLRLIA